MTAVRVAGIGAALGLVGLGGLLTAFALGWIGGTSLEGSTTYAIVGPLLAGLGVALGLVVRQSRVR